MSEAELEENERRFFFGGGQGKVNLEAQLVLTLKKKKMPHGASARTRTKLAACCMYDQRVEILRSRHHAVSKHVTAKVCPTTPTLAPSPWFLLLLPPPPPPLLCARSRFAQEDGGERFGSDVVDATSEEGGRRGLVRPQLQKLIRCWWS